jgi:hypothetical protein
MKKIPCFGLSQYQKIIETHKESIYIDVKPHFMRNEIKQ